MSFARRIVGLAMGAGVYVAAWIDRGLFRSRACSRNSSCSPANWRWRRPTSTNYIDSTRTRFSTGYDQGDLLSRAGGSDARGDREKPGYDPEHPPVGRAAAAADLRADPGDPLVLQFLQRRHRSLPSGRRLSSGHAFRPRAFETNCPRRRRPGSINICSSRTAMASS